MALGGTAQLDLFAEPPAPRWWLGEGERAQAQRQGWERRALRDLASSPLIYCYPGFMGAVCERLVSKGLASREDAGVAPMPEFWPDTKKGRREWAEREPSPQFRYALTKAGLALIAVQEAP